MLGKDKHRSAFKAGHYKDHSFVAKNTELTGDIRFVGGLHVEGVVRGNILSDEGCLHVHGVVEGEVRVPHVVINGVVKGNVWSSKHVELAQHAQVVGNVYYHTMEMVMGAQVNGQLMHASGPVYEGNGVVLLEEQGKPQPVALEG